MEYSQNNQQSWKIYVTFFEWVIINLLVSKSHTSYYLFIIANSMCLFTG